MRVGRLHRHAHDWRAAAGIAFATLLFAGLVGLALRRGLSGSHAEWTGARFGGRLLRRPGGGKPGVAELGGALPPPPGWLRFAAARGCSTAMGYNQVLEDLEAFRDPADPRKRTISQEMLEEAAELPNTVVGVVKSGVLTWSAAKLAREQGPMLAPIASSLPDMKFVFNGLDEPRVLLGGGSIADAYEGMTCAGASEDFRERRHLHGFVTAADSFNVTRTLLPVFSPTKIRRCYSDIVMPSFHYHNFQRVDLAATTPWEEKKEVLFWRGATTGGGYYQGTPYWTMHRHRLVELAASTPWIDAGFTSYVQCHDNATCDDMEARYGTAPWVDPAQQWSFKYHLLVDGNTYNRRLPTYLSSGCLVFRVGMFSEWFDERLKPWRDYIPVKLDYSDLEENVEWARAHDAQAQQIAENAAEAVATLLRKEDLQCYLARELWEYALLLQPQVAGAALAPLPEPAIPPPALLGRRRFLPRGARGSRA